MQPRDLGQVSDKSACATAVAVTRGVRVDRDALGRLAALALVATMLALSVLASGLTLGAQERRGLPFLTGPNQGTPLDIAMNYITAQRQRLGLTPSDVADVVVTDQYLSDHNGVTHIYLRQRFQGIEVLNGSMNINIARDGSVINLDHTFVSNLAAAVNRTSPVHSAEQAVQNAVRHLGLRLAAPLTIKTFKGGPAAEVLFDSAGVSREPIPAKLAFQPIPGGAARLAWLVEIDELGGAHFWGITIDAETAQVLSQTDYVKHDIWDPPAASGPAASSAFKDTGVSAASSSTSNAYLVFAFPKENPDEGPRTLETDPAHPVASPFGWHDIDGAVGAEFTVTRGNNVHAYTDLDVDDVPDPGSDPDGGASLVFDFPLDLTQDPSTYRPAAVTNLFYWNNIIHDVFYGYGFTEAAGNFQVNNYGRGGLGNDDLRAEAQDAIDTHNANFLPTVDGVRPRMQMFIWSKGLPNLVTVNSPAAIAGDYDASWAAFGPALTTTGVTGDLALVNDGSGSSTADGCEPLVGFPAGKIALLERGTCTFATKVKNAQIAGASAAIIMNTVGGSLFLMAGNDPTITIPSVMLRVDHSDLLEANLPVNATLKSKGIPNRDSDLDAAVIVHEYGHGVSTRLTGGPSTASCLENIEQMGEGWSDWLALALTAKSAHSAMTSRGVGNYLVYEGPSGNGIRPTPYTTDMAVNPATYDDIGAFSSVHSRGYVWATMLWEVYWNLIAKHGYNADVYGNWTTGGNNLAIQLVMDGMTLQPCSPGFVDGRDAILMADQLLTEGANQCAVWKGFAKRGLGYSADQGSAFVRGDETEAFDLPPACVASASVNPASLSSNQISDTETTAALAVSNGSSIDGTDLTWTITEAPVTCASPADLPWVSAAPTSDVTPPEASSQVEVTFDSSGLTFGTSVAGKLCLGSNDTTKPTVEVPVSLNVIYNFTGFFPPVANPPTLNDAQAASTVPVMFSLAGNQGLQIFAPGFPASQQINCSTKTPIGPVLPATQPASAALTYDSKTDKYLFPWQTKAGWRGTCRQLTVRLSDGTDHLALFRFK